MTVNLHFLHNTLREMHVEFRKKVVLNKLRKHAIFESSSQEFEIMYSNET